MGSEMCIRDRGCAGVQAAGEGDADLLAAGEILKNGGHLQVSVACLLYTSDAADERSSVDLGGRRIIKKKNT